MIYLPDTDIYSIMPHFVVRNTTPITWLRDIEGRDGYLLQCETDAVFTIEYRVDGIGSWINLVGTPLDLTPYIGLRQRVQFRLTSTAFSADDRKKFKIFAGV